MQLDTYGQQTQVLSQGANRVLRNTYMLLALTMVPTVAGALLGVQLQFSFLAGSPFIAFMLFLGISFAFFYGIEKNKNNGLGVGLLLGFTFFMGLMLSRILQVALGFSNGGSMIALAGGGTGAIFATMATIASVSKRDFSNMGKFLFVGMIVVLLAGVANIFFQVPALSLAISAAVVLIFSAYILYDINQIVRGGETNYVTATLSVYLDVYNVFVSLLNLIMAFTGGDRD
jgi:modulator of FtsH protease